jgi:hypothetical protein
MRKLILSAAALLTFGLASAQTGTTTTPQSQTPANTGTGQMDKAKTDPATSNDVVTKQNAKQNNNEVQPRKDEIKTQDHVKSTPSPSIVQDTVRTTKKSKRAKQRT